jgi:hypothetical protein
VGNAICAGGEHLLASSTLSRTNVDVHRLAPTSTMTYQSLTPFTPSVIKLAPPSLVGQRET